MGAADEVEVIIKAVVEAVLLAVLAQGAQVAVVVLAEHDDAVGVRAQQARDLIVEDQGGGSVRVVRVAAVAAVPAVFDLLVKGDELGRVLQAVLVQDPVLLADDVLEELRVLLGGQLAAVGVGQGGVVLAAHADGQKVVEAAVSLDAVAPEVGDVGGVGQIVPGVQGGVVHRGLVIGPAALEVLPFHAGARHGLVVGGAHQHAVAVGQYGVGQGHGILAGADGVQAALAQGLGFFAGIVGGVGIGGADALAVLARLIDIHGAAQQIVVLRLHPGELVAGFQGGIGVVVIAHALHTVGIEAVGPHGGPEVVALQADHQLEDFIIKQIVEAAVMAVGEAVQVGVFIVEEEAAVVDRGAAGDRLQRRRGEGQGVAVGGHRIGPPDPGADAAQVLGDVEQAVERAALVRAGHDHAGLAAGGDDLDLITLEIGSLEALAAGGDVPVEVQVPDQLVLEGAGDDDDALGTDFIHNIVLDARLEDLVFGLGGRGDGADLGALAGDGAEVLGDRHGDQGQAVIVGAVAVDVDGRRAVGIRQHDGARRRFCGGYGGQYAKHHGERQHAGQDALHGSSHYHFSFHGHPIRGQIPHSAYNYNSRPI